MQSNVSLNINTRILALYTKALSAARVHVVLIGAVAFVAALAFTLSLNAYSGRPAGQLSLVQVLCIFGLSGVACWLVLDSLLKKVITSLSSKQVSIRRSNLKMQEKVKLRTSELESSSLELEHSLRIKSEFLATMSHEIRTPMNGVLGMCQLLGETDLTERQRRYVNIVNASGKSLLDLLNNVLDYSKIEAGKMQVESIPFDLESLVDECLSVFSLKALEKKVNLYGGLASDVPRVCRGDPTRIRQIVMNLLSNAIKFTFDGDVSLRVLAGGRQSENPDLATLRFEVHDQGIGMTEAQQQNLFSAFAQTDVSTARKYGGTGLGLVISKELLELMGGSISVASKLDEGSVFFADIELGRVNALDALAYRKTEKPLSEVSVMVVESPGAAHQLTAQLEYWGASVVSANSVEEARNIVQSSAGSGVNQIISAAVLPDGNGVELIDDLVRLLPHRALQSMVIMPISLESMVPPKGVFKLLERPVTSSELYDAVSLAAATPSAKLPVVAEKRNRGSFADIRALIAEDNQVNQMVIIGILKKFNISAVVVEDGADAVKAMSQQDQSFDLVLMDCEMPVMDGWEATERIRQIEHQNSVENPVKIVALSAHVIAEPKERALRAGMDRFEPKPVDIDSVESLLHEYFPRQGPSDQAGKIRTQ
ncbi:MAG: signal transduction histidine kinase/DNA-binding response OmpR family regulator [Pseudohongiellaceae bacterium]